MMSLPNSGNLSLVNSLSPVKPPFQCLYLSPVRSYPSSPPGAAVPGEDGDGPSCSFLIAILYPTRGSMIMYLGLAASFHILRRSIFTTFRSSQFSPTLSGSHPSSTVPDNIIRTNLL